MSCLTIASLNCQGLGNFQKRRDVFQYLRQKKLAVYFLQDTHFEASMEKQIRSMLKVLKVKVMQKPCEKVVNEFKNKLEIEFLTQFRTAEYPDLKI